GGGGWNGGGGDFVGVARSPGRRRPDPGHARRPTHRRIGQAQGDGNRRDGTCIDGMICFTRQKRNRGNQTADRKTRPALQIDGSGRETHMSPNIPAAKSKPRPAVLPRAHSREIDLLLVISLAVIICSILYPHSFFSRDNLRAILNNLAVDGIL